MTSDVARILVLGAGRVGRAMALDLAADRRLEVTAADAAGSALAALADGPVRTVRAELGDGRRLADLVADFELVIGAVPGFMGLATAQAVLAAGKNYVDISFFPEDALALDGLARERGAVCVVDAGVAPGLSNLLLGQALRELDRVDRFLCYVGGLPVVRRWPWEYAAPFSPVDVIEEYTRPARLVEGGRIVTRPALSEPELIDFPGLGTLEAFNTDGLRTLLTTVPVPEMREKTMRYPGHIDKIRVLRDSGFLGTVPLPIAGAEVRPLDLAARLLADSWAFAPGEEDFTVMRVEVTGEAAGTPRKIVWDLLDRHDHATGVSSMARTTGYTCTAIARLVLSGRWRRTGVAAPEHLPEAEGCAEAVLADLAARGVLVQRRDD